MSVKVIGAGFGRTGTLSLKYALETLGLGKCYHMAELFMNTEQVVHWENAANGKPTAWEELLSGYQSIVDFPGCIYYQDLMKTYPDAKVVLTVRDPERWFESASQTIFPAGPNPIQLITMLLKLPFSKRTRNLLRIIKANEKGIFQNVFQGRKKDKAFAIERFQQHIAEVKKAVPAERLLVYEVSQGWEPLCGFLGLPIPSTPFPKVNRREDFPKMFRLALTGKNEFE